MLISTLITAFVSFASTNIAWAQHSPRLRVWPYRESTNNEIWIRGKGGIDAYNDSWY